MAVTLDDLVRSWLIDLRGRNLSPKTVTTYAGAARRMAEGLPEQCRADAASITRSDLSEYFAKIAQTRTPGGVSVDWRALQQFFRWCDEVESEITPNPMAKLRQPVVPEPETRVLRKEEIRNLLKACEGTDFMSRRDTPVVSLMLDTGMRRAECAHLKTESVSTELRECYVVGKGRRSRIVTFSHATARSLDRYERVRKSHRWAEMAGYWLGDRSRVMTDDGIDQMIRRRGQQAGIPDLHLHMLRHSWAHYAKQVLNDDEVMRLAGWRSREMLNRYAASTAAERAREAGKKTALLDRL